MTPERSYRLGERSARAEATGDELGSRVLYRQVVSEATRLFRAGKRDQANAICQAWEDGYRDMQYREVRATGGVEPGM